MKENAIIEFDRLHDPLDVRPDEARNILVVDYENDKIMYGYLIGNKLHFSDGQIVNYDDFDFKWTYMRHSMNF